MGLAATGSSPGRWPRMRIVIPPSSTKICGAPRAVVLAAPRSAEHLDIPIGRGLRVLADDVHVIELECQIAQRSPLVTLPAPGLRDDTLRHQTESAHVSRQ